MINKIIIENFKKFEKAEIELGRDTILFVGQNNGGKTTALQALSLWSFLAQRWQEKKGKSKAKKRTGTPVPRNEVWASPVKEMRMLWHEGDVQDKKSKKINLRITAYGEDFSSGEKWEYGIEATYSNRELLFCKPTDHNIQQPQEAYNVHLLPPLSGVQTSEKRLDLGAQLRVIGEGRPGEILRNLLLECHDNRPKQWRELQDKVKELFATELLPIKYTAAIDPDITVYYKMSSPSKNRSRTKLEIANAGSGFLQFLLLAAFLYVHEKAILLIDEPDSHMHVFLQRGMYDWLQGVAQQSNSQLVISTHSEVLVNSTALGQVYTFFGDRPKKPSLNTKNIINALKEVSPLDVINAEWKKRMLFAEGDTDLRLLKEWSKVLGHPVKPELDSVHFYAMGNNSIGKAKKEFSALRDVIETELKAFCLRDGDVSKTRDLPSGFIAEYWRQKEIENYLIHPSCLLRFIEKKMGGLGLILKQAEDYLQDNLPPKTFRDPLSEGFSGKGSEFLQGFFSHLKFRINKGEYWEIARIMKKEEIPSEIQEMLDKISDFLK